MSWPVWMMDKNSRYNQDRKSGQKYLFNPYIRFDLGEAIDCMIKLTDNDKTWDILAKSMKILEEGFISKFDKNDDNIWEEISSYVYDKP